MNTFLLLVNTIMNIFIIINIMKINSNNQTEKREKKNNKLSDLFKYFKLPTGWGWSDFDYDDDDFYDDDDADDYVEKKPTRAEALRKKWQDEEDAKAVNYVLNRNTNHCMFKDINEFITYLAPDNLKVVDVVNKKVRTVLSLDDVGKTSRVLKIVFDDNTSDIFKPMVYARMPFI